MRAVYLSDLNIAARTLLAIPKAKRAATIADLLCSAHLADKYRKRTGQNHKIYGNGTLSDACQTMPAERMPDRCDPNYLDCMGIVIQALLYRRAHEDA